MYEKLSLGHSPLTGNIYLGKKNPKKPNQWQGQKKDVTSDFIQVMLQKFEPGYIHNIEEDGVIKYRIAVLDVNDEIIINGKPQPMD